MLKMRLFLLSSLIVISLFFNINFVSKVNAQACPAQAAPTNVTVAYPGCEGTNCNFTQATCSWTAATGATSYIISVTEVETSVAIKAAESVSASTNKVIFPITQNRTYKCDVLAVSSCGSQSGVASDQLLCAADGMLGTAAPTLPPGSAVVPPKSIAAPGETSQTILLIGGVLLIIIVGGVMIKRA